VIDVAKDRLFTSKPYGVARSEREAARIRWVQAYQFARAARCVRDAALREIVEVAETGTARPPATEAAFGLDGIFITHGAKDAARSLLDGGGTSGYSAGNPVRRIAGDIAMIATHILGSDYDVLMERHARWILGLGMTGDPSVRLSGG
jgi:3-hydroxy-9,10-secoandrosta-1,3,5(10)-triene-9,17-dione monooxygenase